MYLPSIKMHFQDSAMFLAKVDLPIPCNNIYFFTFIYYHLYCKG